MEGSQENPVREIINQIQRLSKIKIPNRNYFARIEAKSRKVTDREYFRPRQAADKLVYAKTPLGAGGGGAAQVLAYLSRDCPIHGGKLKPKCKQASQRPTAERHPNHAYRESVNKAQNVMAANSGRVGPWAHGAPKAHRHWIGQSG